VFVANVGAGVVAWLGFDWNYNLDSSKLRDWNKVASALIDSEIATTDGIASTSENPTGELTTQENDITTESVDTSSLALVSLAFDADDDAVIGDDGEFLLACTESIPVSGGVICFDVHDGPIIVTFIGKVGALGCLTEHIKKDSILSVDSYPDLPYMDIVDTPEESLLYARGIYGEIPILNTFSHAPCIRSLSPTSEPTRNPSSSVIDIEVQASQDQVQTVKSMLNEGNSGKVRGLGMTLDFSNEDLVRCDERSCKFINLYLMIDQEGCDLTDITDPSKLCDGQIYELLNMIFFSESSTNNEQNVLQSDRRLKTKYNLLFERETSLTKEDTFRMVTSNIQYGEEPERNTKQFVKVSFVLPKRQGKIEVSTSEAVLSYTLGALWTTVIATFCVVILVFLFVFPNILQKSYFRFQKWDFETAGSTMEMGEPGKRTRNLHRASTESIF